MHASCPTILIIAEIANSNIGDLLIVESTKYLTSLQKPKVKILELPISINKSQPGQQQRISLIKQMARFSENRLPGIYALAQMNAQRFLFRTHRDEYRDLLQQADLILIGGGQLLMDNALGFPAKLQCFSRLARELHKPYHIFSCGVGEYWSLLAREMFTEVLNNAASVSLRDPHYIEHLQKELPELKIQLVPDPALFTADLYPAQTLPASPLLGICPVNLLDFNRHLPKKQQYSEQAWLSWWFGLLGVLTLQRIPFRLYTTGVPQDIQFARQLLQEFALPADTLLPAPASTEEYCRQLQGFSRVITTRLHAAITAHSYGIPALGIIWDEKVRSYFQMMERAADARSVEEVTPTSLLNLLDAARAPSKEVIQAMKQRTAAAVASLMTTCEKMQSKVDI